MHVELPNKKRTGDYVHIYKLTLKATMAQRL